MGGIYIPTAQSEKPRFWIAGAANAAVSNRLDIDENEATRLASGCNGRADLTTAGQVNSMNITVVSSDSSAKALGRNAAAGVLSTALVNGIIGARDGRILFPPVTLSDDTALSRAISPGKILP